MTTVGLCYDLKSDYMAAGFTAEQVMEMDDEEVVAGLEQGLRSLGYRVKRIGRGLELARRLAAGERWDMVFNFTEGVSGRGREAQVPALCELYGQAYTFSDPVTCGVTLDKAWAKRLVRDAGVATAPFAVVHTPEEAESVSLEPPLFVKPLAEGSSMGVSRHSLVRSCEELPSRCRELLASHPGGLLVEGYLPGREFTVGLVGSGAAAKVVAVMEVLYTRRAESQSYTAANKAEYLTNVRYRLLRKGPLAKQARAVALACYSVLECRDAGRVDLRCDREGRPHFLEINPLPGLHPVRSDLPIMAGLAGIPYSWLLNEIMGSALARAGSRPPAARRPRSEASA